MSDVVLLMKSQHIISKYQKYLLVAALLLAAIAVSIRGSGGEVKLVLHKYPALITLLVTVSLFLVAIYFQINKKKLSSLSNQIKEQSKINSEENDTLINRLTERQKAVYDLIISGKANKEIMAELFIEQSTLKSHINQIYKKLKVKSRRELKSKFKP